MNTPDLILLAGLPASGKSHFARLLHKRLGYPVIGKDEIKEILFDDVGFRSREEKVKLGVAAMDIMYEQADTLLGLGISVILDNNFENISLPGVRRLMEKHHPNTVTVRFDGDPMAAYQRFVKRDADPRRHRGHVLNTCYPETGEPEPYVPIGEAAFEEKFRSRGVMDFYPGGKLITVDVSSFENYSEQELFERLSKELVNYEKT